MDIPETVSYKTLLDELDRRYVAGQVMESQSYVYELALVLFKLMQKAQEDAVHYFERMMKDR